MHILYDESVSMNEKTFEQWKELLNLVEEYDPINIFNCDETGRYFRTMPDRNLVFGGEP